ncbi:hypothetical protein LX92_04195 [Maribacter polysiphoniae]|uniref:Uncharacterized protein n=1 Tax=Maribacter polysiphoniae TaxID=429344 RepID=A0A316DP24_9FLAO|nr:hypothetical protein LX92_04195 [Maribacter polysiphoniae]
MRKLLQDLFTGILMLVEIRLKTNTRIEIEGRNLGLKSGYKV